MPKAICPCGNPANAGTICNRCVKATSRRLGDQVALADELEVALTRQARLSAPTEGGRSADRPLPYNIPASDLLAEQRRLLTRWVTACVRDLHTPEPAAYTVRGLSLHIEANLKDLRKHQDAAALVVDLDNLCARILETIDRQDPTLPIGPCPIGLENGGYCPGEVWGFVPLSDPDSKRPSKIACKQCGTEWPPEQWTGLARMINRRKAAA